MTIIKMAIILAASLSPTIPPSLLVGLCSAESDLRGEIINHQDGGSPSFGVCQIKLTTARMLGYSGTSDDLLDPFINAKYAAKYLDYQLKRYDGNICDAISAYNMGRVKKLKNGNYRNSDYVRKVLERWNAEEKESNCNRRKSHLGNSQYGKATVERLMENCRQRTLSLREPKEISKCKRN